PGQRAILGREGEAGLRFEAERQAEGAPNGAAMRDGDDVAAAMLVEYVMDRPRDALEHVDKALAARRPLVCRRMPEAVERAAARVLQFLVGEALPITKTLLGEIGDRLGFGSGDRVGAGQTGAHDGGGGFMRAAQIADDPDRVARQLPRQTGENRRLVAI